MVNIGFLYYNIFLGSFDMITEDNYNIYIENKECLKDLIKLKASRYGSNSDIYFYKDKLLKVYNHLAYISEIKNLEIISKLNIDNVAIPRKFIYIDERFYGYSMDYKKGVILPKINDRINYNYLITNLDKVEETIRILSNYKMEMYDINCFNILYDISNSEFNLVDIDSYREKKYDSLEKLYKENLFSFDKSLLNCISFKYTINDNLIFNNLKNIITECINKDITTKDTFINIKKFLEKYGNKEINTVKDFRKILKK